MQKSLFILGRQSTLAFAELESLYPDITLTPIGTSAAIIDTNPTEVNFKRIGGSVKLAAVLTELPTIDWNKIVDYVSTALPEHVTYLPEGKLKLGFSVYGLNITAATINKSALQIKKIIKQSGRSIRIVPNSEQTLNSAQVLHNQLTSPLGLELIFVRNGDKTIIAQTIAEQDIESYAARDQKRPMRDARVGMLPPKLAQIIVNLAVGSKVQSKKDQPTSSVVLDPFCGTGVVLQEAGLMGFAPYGTDLDERMVRYSRDNINWLQQNWSITFDWHLEVGDATSLQWRKPLDAIACETYLGRPFSSLPDQDTLTEVMSDVNLILKRFLQNVARQTDSGFPLCIAVPAWKTPAGFKHLKLLDSLEVLGYTRQSFVHASAEELIYFREGQIVARELVVLKRS
jgi:tRNA G10  N-methylase Trm11